MLDFAKRFLCVLLALGGIKQASAFSIIGAFDTWQTVDIGYQIDSELGGPMVLGDEYRRNTPTIIYAFDSSFLDYFGQRGVVAVEAAIKMLNDLPNASAINLDDFPLDSRRFNFQAAALGILDLKSYALARLVEQLGLTSPEAYVWSLRARVVRNNVPFYSTIMRNFDPVTFEPTPYVNGTLYTYQIFQTYAQPDTWEAVEIAVDPFAPSVTSVAALSVDDATSDARGFSQAFGAGMFYTGLTRDDVGGLKYLYRESNVNGENLPPDAVAGIVQGPTPSSGGGSTSPWFPASGTAPPTGTTTPVTTPATNLVIAAPRPGIEKVTFVRANLNAGFGLSFSNVVPYQDRFLTNSAVRSQQVTRVVVAPDIVFFAGDMGVVQEVPVASLRNGATLQNNSGLNANPNRSGNAGPGTIEGAAGIGFSNILPYFLNSPESGQDVATRSIVWGTFDASTNAPVIFPLGLSIRAIEQQILP